MSTFGICMVKDEADIIGYTLAHMLTQVDAIIVADNASTDGTRDIVEGFDGVLVIDDPEVAYFQSRKMTHLAELAGHRGADWVVPFDADEIWFAPWGRIADVLADFPGDEGIATATLYDHVATGVDVDDPNPVTRTRWRRRDPGVFPKVACRPVAHVTIEQGNHGAHYPSTTPNRVLEVRHFPYRSAAQMARKARNGAAAYAATDLDESEGAHWRQYGALLESGGEEAIDDVFHTWFWSPDPTVDDGLVEDPAPVRS